MGGGIDEWVEVVMDNFFSFVSLVCVRERERGDGTIKIDNEKREEKGTVCLGGGQRTLFSSSICTRNGLDEEAIVFRTHDGHNRVH